jgi:hypothetical protein
MSLSHDPPFNLARAFPSVEEIAISYLQATPGDGYPGSSYTWDPARGDRLTCSSDACLEGGVSVSMLISPIVAMNQTKAVRKLQCGGQERLHTGAFRSCRNIFMIAVDIRYLP